MPAPVPANVASPAQLPNAPRRYVLCPVVDLCNHSGDAVSDLAYEYFQDS